MKMNNSRKICHHYPFFQPVAKYEWAKEKRLTWINGSRIEWPTADGQPPPDIPECGFSGSDGQCAAKGQKNSWILIILLLLISLCNKKSKISRWICAWSIFNPRHRAQPLSPRSTHSYLDYRQSGGRSGVCLFNSACCDDVCEVRQRSTVVAWLYNVKPKPQFYEDNFVILCRRIYEYKTFLSAVEEEGAKSWRLDGSMLIFSPQRWSNLVFMVCILDGGISTATEAMVYQWFPTPHLIKLISQWWRTMCAGSIFFD